LLIDLAFERPELLEHIGDVHGGVRIGILPGSAGYANV
jgi:hypothetical protein